MIGSKLVSIVLTTINGERFIQESIESCVSQTYENIEIIVVDGGSTDGSVEIIQKCADHLAWWVTEPDAGQAEAINKGFQRATGEIVAWLNSDDMYAPGAISDAVEFLDHHPEVGLVFGNAASFNQDGVPLNEMRFTNWGLEGLVAFNIICQPAVFFRRAVLEQAGYLDQHYHMMLDHQFWLRIARITNIQHVPKLWAFARHHADAKNVAQAPRFGEEAFHVFAWMQSQPDLAEIISQNENIIMAMLHRFTARYLLDGGLAWKSLQSYGRSLLYSPRIALQEWHRILYSVLSVMGLSQLGEIYYHRQQKKLPESVLALGIENIHQIYS